MLSLSLIFLRKLFSEVIFLRKKLSFCLILTLFCLALIPLSASAQFEAVQKATFTGHAVLFVKADRAVIGISLQAKADSKAAAYAEIEALSENAAKLCGKLCSLTTESTYVYSESDTGKFAVDRYMVAVTSKPEKADEIVSKITLSGIAAVNYVNYFIDDVSKEQDRVLQAAIADAVSKAQGIDDGFCISEISDTGVYSYSLEPCQRSEQAQVAVEGNVLVVFTKK